MDTSGLDDWLQCSLAKWVQFGEAGKMISKRGFQWILRTKIQEVGKQLQLTFLS